MSVVYDPQRAYESSRWSMIKTGGEARTAVEWSFVYGCMEIRCRAESGATADVVSIVEDCVTCFPDGGRGMVTEESLSVFLLLLEGRMREPSANGRGRSIAWTVVYVRRNVVRGCVW